MKNAEKIQLHQSLDVLTFEQAELIATQLVLENATLSKNLSEKYSKYRLANGLTPDHIKFSEEYQEDKRKYDVSFQRLRNFNGWYSKKFKKELQQKRYARYNIQ